MWEVHGPLSRRLGHVYITSIPFRPRRPSAERAIFDTVSGFHLVALSFSSRRTFPVACLTSRAVCSARTPGRPSLVVAATSISFNHNCNVAGVLSVMFLFIAQQRSRWECSSVHIRNRQRHSGKNSRQRKEMHYCKHVIWIDGARCPETADSDIETKYN